MRSLILSLCLAGCGSSTTQLASDACGTETEAALPESEWPAFELTEIATAHELAALSAPDSVAMEPLTAHLGALEWDGPWIEVTTDEADCFDGGESRTRIRRWITADATIAGVDHDTLVVSMVDDAFTWSASAVNAVENPELIDSIETHYGSDTSVDDAEISLSATEWTLTVWTSGAVSGSHSLTGAVTPLME